MTALKLDEMIFTRVVSDKLSERAGARAPPHALHRSRSLPALGMPVSRRRRRLATAVSIALHFLFVWLLLRPEALTNLDPNLKLMDHGNLGNGIAGGGGGGTRGSGGVKFVQVAPPAQPVPPPQTAPVLPPIEQVPKPVIPEPVIPQLELPKLATTDPKAELKVESPIIGTGGGIGNDGTKGNGPGSGGGIGNGIGTGVGSGTGPGTGAGKLDYIECRNIEMPLFPLPPPANVKGFTLIANFDVDEKGKILKVDFTPTRNGDYNRRINDVLRTMRWKPATTLAGIPIRKTCQLTYNF
jgi:protein TonB